jgi:hypothetical protein
MFTHNETYKQCIVHVRLHKHLMIRIHTIAGHINAGIIYNAEFSEVG